MKYMWTVIVFFGVIVLGVMSSPMGEVQLAYLFDESSFILVVFPSFLMALLVTSRKAWLASLRLSFRSKIETSQNEIMSALRFLQICRKVALCMGALSIFMAAVFILADLTNMENIGTNAKMALNSGIYGICITVLCLAAESRIEHRFSSLISAQTEISHSPQEPFKEPRRSKKGLLIGAAVVLMLLISGGAASYYFLLMPTDEIMSLEELQSEREQFLNEAEPFYSPTYCFTVRLSDGKNAAKICLTTMMKDEAALEYLSMRIPTINDSILRQFSEYDAEILLGKEGKKTAERDLLQKINSFFSQEFIEYSDYQDLAPVKRVLFCEFLIAPMELLLDSPKPSSDSF